MDRLQQSHFLEQLTGRVFLSQFDAWQALSQSTSDEVGGDKNIYCYSPLDPGIR